MMIRYMESISPEEYVELRRKAGWAELAPEQAAACVEKAYMIRCARDDDKAVGMARLLWDGGYIAYLSDVVVDPEYQGRGVGSRLVEACIDGLKNDMKPGYRVKMTLSSTRGKESFYERFGFRIRPNEDVGAGMDQWFFMEE